MKPLAGSWSDALAAEIEGLHPDLVIQAGERDDIWPKGLRKSPTERLLTSSRVPLWVVRLTPAIRPRVFDDGVSTRRDDDLGSLTEACRRLHEDREFTRGLGIRVVDGAMTGSKLDLQVERNQVRRGFVMAAGSFEDSARRAV